MPSSGFKIFTIAFAALLIVGLGFMSPAESQSPAGDADQDRTPKNLQYFPEGTTRDELMVPMRQFSFALGVACTHCHGTEDQTGFSLRDVDFSLDIKPTKNKAREMLRMTEKINTDLLAAIPDSELDLEVTCFTCHSGLALPEAIEARELRMIEADGVEGAIEDYRNVRESYFGSAAYNFGEQPLVEVAASLHNAKQYAAAAAICKLNLEFYPESGQSKFRLAEAYFELGDTKSARPIYEEMLEARPDSRAAKARLEQIEKLEAAEADEAKDSEAQ